MKKKMTTDQRLDALLHYLQVDVSVAGHKKTGEPIISAGAIYLYSPAPIGCIVSETTCHPWDESFRVGRERHNLLLNYLGLEEYKTVARPSKKKIRKKGKK